MSHRFQSTRYLAIAAVATSLCSCKAPGIFRPTRPPVAQAMACDPGVPCPAPQDGAIWNPGDEYVCDGGDKNVGVAVAPNWQIYNLDPQDTIVHYDTLDGQTHVKASNKVCLYAPRFGAVRVVTTPILSGQVDQAQGMLAPNKANRFDKAEIATTSLQREPLGNHAAALLPEGYTTRQGEGIVSTQLSPIGFQDAFLPYANLLVMRTGEFENSEKARLAQAADAALTWSSDQAVQVVIDGKQAKALVSDQKVQATYTTEDLRQPCLRVLKIADTNAAKPGDIVEFTIRYDNIGTAPLGNIVLVDHLVSRLELVPDSAQSSMQANFSTQDNTSTLTLRWEFEQHLEAGQGGLVRFKCRVR